MGEESPEPEPPVADEEAPSQPPTPEPGASEEPEPLDPAVARERIDELEEAKDELAERVEELEAETERLTDTLARVQADYENYRKRAKRERREAARDARIEMIEILVDVVDNVERAMDADPSPEVEKGLEMVLQHVDRELEAVGVETLAPEPGDGFDPSEHEPTITEATDAYEPETVIELLQPGYELGGRQIRPAMVKVAAPAEPEDAPDGASGSEGQEEEGEG